MNEKEPFAVVCTYSRVSLLRHKRCDMPLRNKRLSTTSCSITNFPFHVSVADRQNYHSFTKQAMPTHKPKPSP